MTVSERTALLGSDNIRQLADRDRSNADAMTNGKQLLEATIMNY